jgi:uncharacterized membrane protein
MGAQDAGAATVRQARRPIYPAPVDTPAARLYLDAAIAPTRSMPRQGLLILLGVVIAINLAVGTAFVLMGAAPVPIFLGLDVLGVSLAFWASNRGPRMRERVRVTAEQVMVLHEGRRGARMVWTSPTAFTRVRLEDTGRYGRQVRLSMSGKDLTIGQVLGPKERAGLVETIDDAIRAARAERYSP